MACGGCCPSLPTKPSQAKPLDLLQHLGPGDHGLPLQHVQQCFEFEGLGQHNLFEVYDVVPIANSGLSLIPPYLLRLAEANYRPAAADEFDWPGRPLTGHSHFAGLQPRQEGAAQALSKQRLTQILDPSARIVPKMRCDVPVAAIQKSHPWESRQ